MASISEVSQAIDGLVNWVNNMRVEEVMEPSTGSIAATDSSTAADDVQRKRLDNARALATARILTARSCLHAARMCFDLPDPAPACHVLSRTVVENSARAQWLVAPRLTLDQRVARTAADELHGLDERRRLLHGSSQDLTELQKDVDNLRSKLVDAGIRPAVRPPATDLAAELLAGGSWPGALMYRLFSAVPHGSWHTLLIRHTSSYAEPTRLATLGLMMAFDDLAKYIGWGGRPAFQAWAGRTSRGLTTADDVDPWASNM